MKKFKLLLTTLCCLVGLGCFCNAVNYNQGIRNTLGTCNSTVRTLDQSGFVCFYQETNQHLYVSIDNGNNYTDIGRYGMYCANASSFKYYCNTSYDNYMYYWNFGNYVSDCPSCPSCPSQYTSLECQSHYNLIPISSVDQNYCTTNNLCPISGGGDCTGSNWSALYINGVQHDSAGIIDIDISEDISWDYNLTGSQFNLDIVGYNVDYEKINEIVNIQEYKPSSKDFTQVVGALVPYIRILVFLLFCFIIIKRLKKPFSSKLK